MPDPHEPYPTTLIRVASPGGLRVEATRLGAIRHLAAGDVHLNLFVGNEAEGGVANVYLRRLDGPAVRVTPLLGPASPSRVAPGDGSTAFEAHGEWCGIAYRLALVLAAGSPAWFWHLALRNTGDAPVTVDALHAQDLALAPYGAVRLNEYYVSQYIDHVAVEHARHGWAVLSRQNQAAGGRHPWCVTGSLGRAVSYATDLRQLHGLHARDPLQATLPPGLAGGLPGQRLQHEHALAALQEAPLTLPPGASASVGFFGSFVADHPEASSAAGDAAHIEQVLALPEARPPAAAGLDAPLDVPQPSLFVTAPVLAARDLTLAEIDTAFGSERRHEERAADGGLLSFFHGADRHVVLRAKELQVLRPHGHLLRSGRHATPDERALTSTAWMGGVFHSMLTQGHVSFNRLLSTVHGYLGVQQAHGLRLFVETADGWRRLHTPSAFEISPDGCRWLYRHDAGLIEVRAEASPDPVRMRLALAVLEGGPVRGLASLHVALNGDDGSTSGPVHGVADGPGAWRLTPAPGSELAQRFPYGDFRLHTDAGTPVERVGGDDLLYPDGLTRGEPYFCVQWGPARAFAIGFEGRLVDDGPDRAPLPAPSAEGQPLQPVLEIDVPAASPLAEPMRRFADVIPWFTHDALVHYLSPRGLEQYSGGGWGTRDVCQGPVELLLAGGHMAPVRDLLLRVMRAQNADGDWPQWFMFFARERHIRAGDSHGDVAFWPLLAIGQYLLASGDGSLLDEPVPFFDSEAGVAPASVWLHMRRAMTLIERRTIAGTMLAAYGHGDWNDALQPADPALREHLCSAWTVTLHCQTLATLARGLRAVGRLREAARCERRAQAVRADFRRLLMPDGVLAGYAHFEPEGGVRFLLHPRDEATGVRFSALAMVHAVLEDLLDPAEARAHLALIDEHLLGPDGLRLFDRPMDYRGGLQRRFQRAESASFFGREIGLMYMHAHLRYAQALAHVGDAAGFFRALSQACPIGIASLVPQAAPRQANCYYSSSDAAFADRYEASAEYGRVSAGTVPLDGGWRVYSSGAGIAVGLLVRRLLGLSQEAGTLVFDPVMPPALDGLHVRTLLAGRPVEIVYRVGAAGCGVTALRLDGRALPFAREPHAHRAGAARVAMAAWGAGGLLEIDVG